MARHDDKRSRVTPKGTRSTSATSAGAESGRSVGSGMDMAAQGPSPSWVPVLMFVLLIAGVLLILLNYLAPLPGAPSNWYLLAGLGLVLGGIVTATQYR